MNDETDTLDKINDAVQTDSVHDSIMGAISDYCEAHDLDPDGFTYSLTIDTAEQQ